MVWVVWSLVGSCLSSEGEGRSLSSAVVGTSANYWTTLHWSGGKLKGGGSSSCVGISSSLSV